MSQALSQKGFTLIEILIVLVILGVVIGLATLGLSGGVNRTLQKEAQRLHAVLSYTHNEALIQGSELGLILGDDHYQVLAYNYEANSWEVPNETYYERHHLPNNLHLIAEIEGQQVGSSATRQLSFSETDRPSVLFLSSGEITPFRIFLRNRENNAQSAVISSDGYSGVLIY